MPLVGDGRVWHRGWVRDQLHGDCGILLSSSITNSPKAGVEYRPDVCPESARDVNVQKLVLCKGKSIACIMIMRWTQSNIFVQATPPLTLIAVGGILTTITHAYGRPIFASVLQGRTQIYFIDSPQRERLAHEIRLILIIHRISTIPSNPKEATPSHIYSFKFSRRNTASPIKPQKFRRLLTLTRP